MREGRVTRATPSPAPSDSQWALTSSGPDFLPTSIPPIGLRRRPTPQKRSRWGSSRTRAWSSRSSSPGGRRGRRCWFTRGIPDKCRSRTPRTAGTPGPGKIRRAPIDGQLDPQLAARPVLQEGVGRGHRVEVRPTSRCTRPSDLRSQNPSQNLQPKQGTSGQRRPPRTVIAAG